MIKFAKLHYISSHFSPSFLSRSEKPILEFFYDEIAKTNNGTTPPPPPPTPPPQSTPASKAANNNGTSTPVKHRYAPQKIFEKFGSLENVTARAIIHGFGSSCTHVWVYEMRTALMAVVRYYYY